MRRPIAYHEKLSWCPIERYYYNSTLSVIFQIIFVILTHIAIYYRTSLTGTNLGLQLPQIMVQCGDEHAHGGGGALHREAALVACARDARHALRSHQLIQLFRHLPNRTSFRVQNYQDNWALTIVSFFRICYVNCHIEIVSTEDEFANNRHDSPLLIFEPSNLLPYL